MDPNHSKAKEFQLGAASAVVCRESPTSPSIPQIEEPHRGQTVTGEYPPAGEKMKNPWVRIGFDTWSLGLEASSVIGLRLMKIAAGGAAAEAETRLMLREKFETVWAIQGKAMMGALGLTPYSATTRTLAHYRRKVRSNQRRLRAR